MLAYFIYSLTVILVLLVGVLIQRIYSFSTNSPKMDTSLQVVDLKNKFFPVSSIKGEDYESKMDALKMAQVFAGMQMVEIRRNFDNQHLEQLSWVREAISLYLIGAIDFIGKQSDCSVNSRKELIGLVLKSNLHLSKEVTSEYFQEALNRATNSDCDQMVRAGAKAAKAWLNQNSVPSDFSLKTQLAEWGVFA